MLSVLILEAMVESWFNGKEDWKALTCAFAAVDVLLKLHFGFTFTFSWGPWGSRRSRGPRWSRLTFCTWVQNAVSGHSPSPGSRKPAESCTCPQDTHRTASLFLQRFLSTEYGAINSLKCCLLESEPDRASQGVGHQCILSVWITGPLESYHFRCYTAVILQFRFGCFTYS